MLGIVVFVLSAIHDIFIVLVPVFDNLPFFSTVFCLPTCTLLGRVSLALLVADSPVTSHKRLLLKAPEHFFTTEVYFLCVDWMENGVFGANFLLKQRAYHNDGRSHGKKARKLTLKSSVVNKLKVVKLARGGGGRMDTHMEQTGMLVVLRRGVNFGFWSR